MDVGFTESRSAQGAEQNGEQMSSFAPSHNSSPRLTPDQTQMVMHVMQGSQDAPVAPLASSRVLRQVETAPTAQQFNDMPNRILRLIRDLDIAEGSSFFSLADLNRILSESETDCTETEKIIELHKRSFRMRAFMSPTLSEELIQFMITQERVSKNGKEWFKTLKYQLGEFFDQERSESIIASLNHKKELVQFLCADIMDSRSSSVNRQDYLKFQHSLAKCASPGGIILAKCESPGGVNLFLEVGFKLLDKQLAHAVREMGSEGISGNTSNQFIKAFAAFVRLGLARTIDGARSELVQLFVDAYVLLKEKYIKSSDFSPYLDPPFPGVTALSLATVNAKEEDPASMEVLRILLQSPIRNEMEILTQGNFQETPLILAVQENNFPVTMMLLHANANVNQVCSNDITPLIATVIWGNHEDSVIKILDALLKAGADVQARAGGLTALDWVENENPNQSPTCKRAMSRMLNQSKNKCTLM